MVPILGVYMLKYLACLHSTLILPPKSQQQYQNMLESVPNWLWWLIALYIATPIIGYIAIPFLFYGTKSTKKRIILYVLGDIGHSPRMCYHARSFASKGFDVEFCGYIEEQPPIDILENHKITIHVLPQWKSTKKEAFLLVAIKKVAFQVYHILKQLWNLRGSDYILIQNPPSIPILPIAVVFKIFTRCKLIIDWHNFGYSILQLKLGSFWNPLVLVSYMTEYVFGKFADYNLTVTQAMKQYLVDKFGLPNKKIAILYDRPGSQFRPLKTSRADALKQNFIKDYIPSDFSIDKGDKILITSTSFTPDEDLSILIGSLKIYENSFHKFDDSLPRILCFITGKGPLKQEFVDKVAQQEWNRVTIKFLWLSPEDYPKLLQLCDYGVSLHKSSSGLDLPMKILDMFGSGLPVIALNYPVLDELVQHDVNGLKFIDRRELHEALIFAVKDAEVYKVLKDGALSESENRWEQSWEKALQELKIVR